MEKSIKSVQSSTNRSGNSAGCPGWLVAAALVLIVASVLWMRHSAREQALAELLDLHVATMASANPVDVISTDRHTVKPWFQGKLPFTFNLPELQNSPFKLVGGRVMYFKHTQAPSFSSNLRNHQMSVFVLQDQAGMIPLASGITATREMAFNSKPGAKADYDTW